MWQASTRNSSDFASTRTFCEAMEERQFLSVSVQVADGSTVTVQSPTTADTVQVAAPSLAPTTSTSTFVGTAANAGTVNADANAAVNTTFDPVEFMGPLVTRDPTAFDSTGVLVDTSSTLVGPGFNNSAAGVNGSGPSFIGSGLGIGGISGSPGIDRSINSDVGLATGLSAGFGSSLGVTNGVNVGLNNGISNDLRTNADIGLGASAATGLDATSGLDLNLNSGTTNFDGFGTTGINGSVGSDSLFGGSSTLSGGSGTLFGGSTSDASLLTGTSSSANSGTFSDSPVSSNFSLFGSFGTSSLFG